MTALFFLFKDRIMKLAARREKLKRNENCVSGIHWNFSPCCQEISIYNRQHSSTPRLLQQNQQSVYLETGQAREKKKDIKWAVCSCGVWRSPLMAVNEYISFSASLLWLIFWITRETGDIYSGQLSNCFKPDLSALLRPDTSSMWWLKPSLGTDNT